jgi:hypothetical protein
LETDSGRKAFILARRFNGNSKFRKVRPIQKFIEYDELEFDNDSVESCSDEDDLESEADFEFLQ